MCKQMCLSKVQLDICLLLFYSVGLLVCLRIPPSTALLWVSPFRWGLACAEFASEVGSLYNCMTL